MSDGDDRKAMPARSTASCHGDEVTLFECRVQRVARRQAVRGPPASPENRTVRDIERARVYGGWQWQASRRQRFTFKSPRGVLVSFFPPSTASVNPRGMGQQSLFARSETMPFRSQNSAASRTGAVLRGELKGQRIPPQCL